MSDAFQFGLKTAEIMLPGNYASGRNAGLSGLSSSPVVPPLTGPLQDDLSPGAFSAAVAKSMAPDPLTGVDPRMKALMDANDQQVHTNALQVAAAPHLKIQQQAAVRAAAQAAEQQRMQSELKAIRPGARYHDWSTAPKTRMQTLYEDFVEKPKQTMRNYGEMARAFASGFSPKVNPVTRFVDQATDPNIGLGGAVANATGANDPNSMVGRARSFVDNVSTTARNARDLSDKIVNATNEKPTDPAALAAAQTAPAPTMRSYLADSFTQNPLLWGLPAAGLGGLGAYGLYKALQARRDAKKRRRLMAPAAIIH